MQKHPSPLNFHAFLKAKFPLLYQSSKSGTNKKQANYRKKRSFLQLCVFAEKNTVSLAKPDCKGALVPKKP